MLAARYSIRHEGLLAALGHGRGIVVAVFELIFLGKSRRSSIELVQSRLNACESCPIYVPDLQTCGDARVLDDKDPLGCFCYMPVKTKFKNSRCWLNEQGITDKGWQEAAV